MDKPRIICHIEKSLNYTIFDVKWIPCSAKFLVLGSKPNGTGIIQLYELNASELDLVKEIEKGSAFKCASFGASTLRQRHLAVGDFLGRLQILDLERPDIPVYNTKAHKEIINSLDGIGGVQINCGAPEIVTGSRDGSVKVWDPRQGSGPVVDISAKPTEEGGTGQRDCWTVAFGNSFNNEERYVAAGYDNGDVKLFDLRQMSAVWEVTLKNGICSVEFDRKDIPMNKLVVTTLEGGLHVYDMRTRNAQKGYACVSEKNAGRALGSNGVISGSKATVWAVKHLPQNRDIFATCGGTGSVRLWNYEYPDKRQKDIEDGGVVGVPGTLNMLHAVTMSGQPVSSFDWSPDKMGLGVCGAFDQTVRVFITTKMNLYS